MSNFRAIRDSARASVHQQMAVPAYYLPSPDATPVKCNVRVWPGFTQIGRPVVTGKQYAEMQESLPTIRFLSSDISVKARNAVVLLDENNAFTIDTFDPDDFGYTTAHVTQMTVAAAKARWSKISGDDTAFADSGIMQIKRAARDDLHGQYEVSAYYLMPKSTSPVSTTIRVWAAYGGIGQGVQDAANYATRYDNKTKLRLLAADLPLMLMNAIVAVSATEVYRIATFFAVDDQYVTADVNNLPADEAATEWATLQSYLEASANGG